MEAQWDALNSSLFVITDWSEFWKTESSLDFLVSLRYKEFVSSSSP